MNTTFVSQNPKDGLPAHFENHFLEAAQFRPAAFQFLDLEPMSFGISGVHPVKIRGEQSRFISASPSSNFHDRIAILVRLRREKRVLDRLAKVLPTRSSRSGISA